MDNFKSDVLKFATSISDKLRTSKDFNNTILVDQVAANFFQTLGTSLLVQALIACCIYQFMMDTGMHNSGIFGYVFVFAYLIVSYIRGSLSQKSNETSNFGIGIILGVLLGFGRLPIVWLIVAITGSLIGVSTQCLIMAYQFEKKSAKKSTEIKDNTIETSLNSEDSFTVKVSTVKHMARFFTIIPVSMMYLNNSRTHYDSQSITYLSFLSALVLATKSVDIFYQNLSMDDHNTETRGTRPNQMAVGLPIRAFLNLFK